MGQLLDRLGELDSTAKVLVDRPEVEWVRSRLGIIGLVSIQEPANAGSFRQMISVTLELAHGFLDALSPMEFSRSDVWNLLLLVRVPWTRQEIKTRTSEAAVLIDLCNDVVASRKVVIWKDADISDYFWSRVASVGSAGLATVDPLRQTLEDSVRTKEELQALEFLFKRKISREELERAISVLAEGPRP